MADKGRLDDIGNEVKGKAQQAAGDLTGDDELKARGQGNETKGKVGQAAEDVKDAVKDTADDIKDTMKR